MSNKPSTMDSIRSTAASATHTVAETIDPSQNQGNDNTGSNAKNDSQGTSSDKSFKEQLDEAAYTYTPPGAEKKQESLVEKVTSYIPGMSSSQKSRPEHSSQEERKDEDINAQTVPKRPDHDLQVEEFLKEQYRSKSGADMPNVGE